jgi:hypothetical protein
MAWPSAERPALGVVGMNAVDLAGGGHGGGVEEGALKAVGNLTIPLGQTRTFFVTARRWAGAWTENCWYAVNHQLGSGGNGIEKSPSSSSPKPPDNSIPLTLSFPPTSAPNRSRA